MAGKDGSSVGSGGSSSPAAQEGAAPSSHLPMPAPLLCFSHLQFWLVSAGFSNGISYTSVREALVLAFHVGMPRGCCPWWVALTSPSPVGFWPRGRANTGVCWCRGALPSPALPPITPISSSLSERCIYGLPQCVFGSRRSRCLQE